MRNLARLLVLAWLLANVALLATDGAARLARDRAIGRLERPADRRAAIWGGELGASLQRFEDALEDARPADRILVVAPRPRNVFESLAEHRLFPARVELADASPEAADPSTELGPDAIADHARRIGVACALFQDASGTWRVLRADGAR